MPPSWTPPPTPAFTPTHDPLTPARDITHRHFQPGDQVVVIKGVAAGELWGDSMRVVAPSWRAEWRCRPAWSCPGFDVARTLQAPGRGER